MKLKIKKLLEFLFNPRLLICIVIAWLITNGWSYLALGLGSVMDIHWLTAVAGAYIAFLWLPVSPEKLVTLALAIFLLKRLFPKDEKTLRVLKAAVIKTKKTLGAVKQKKNAKSRHQTVRNHMQGCVGYKDS